MWWLSKQSFRAGSIQAPSQVHLCSKAPVNLTIRMGFIDWQMGLRARALGGRICNQHKDGFYWWRMKSTWVLFTERQSSGLGPKQCPGFMGDSGEGWLHRRAKDHQGARWHPFQTLGQQKEKACVLKDSGFSSAFCELRLLLYCQGMKIPYNGNSLKTFLKIKAVCTPGMHMNRQPTRWERRLAYHVPVSFVQNM